MTAHDDTFSLEEAIAVQKDLRRALGLGPETFAADAFVGMISDEIEQLRAQGRSDEQIADLIASASGKSFDAALIGRFYAPPAERHPGR